MKKRFITSILVTVCFLLTLGTTPASASVNRVFKKSGSTDRVSSYVTDEIIVKFNPGVSEARISQLTQKHDSSVRHTSPRGKFKLIRIPKDKTAQEMVAVYSSDVNVEYAELNTICQAAWQPNDPYYPDQWHLDNPDYGGINCEEAWDLDHENPGQGVIVAVLDTGVAYEDYGSYRQAPDLAQTHFVPGWDFANGDSHPNDDHYHGTHVTGTIAQSTNNNLGCAGVASGVSIMPVKVLNSRGSGYTSWVADGIYWATDHGAQVINMSLAWPVYSSGAYNPGTTLRNAVQYAYEHGVTIVAASGNDYEDSVAYPAAYDDYVIAVGATTYNESLASYSNTGSSLDLVAPGSNVYQQRVLNTNPQTFTYYSMSGTSCATPHVSGVAALVVANGITNPDDVRSVIETTAEDHGTSGWDIQYGWGIVDAYNALQVALPAGDPPVADAGEDQSGNESSPISFDGSGSYDPDGTIITYSWNFGDGNSGSGENPSHAYTDDGTYTVTLAVTDNNGLTNSDTTTATIGNLDPTAEAGGPYSGTEDTPINFTGSATDPGSDTLTYSWNFGDGNSGSGASPSPTYAQDGSYTATLTVTDDDGGSAVDTATVTVADTEPTAAFSYPPGSPSTDGPVQFTDTSNSYDGITSWNWDFGDTNTSTAQNPSHTYASAGTYTVTLTVTEADSDTDIVSDTISVSAPNQPPVADPNGSDPYTGTENTPLSFDGSGSYDPDGTITSYSWNFGDGGSASGVSPSHTYVDGGTYTVTLTVEDDDGATDTESTTATITEVNDPPIAEPNGPYSGSKGETITFDGSGSTDEEGPIASYNWNFGDGNSGSGVSPTHSYSTAGTYTVTLIVNDGSLDSTPVSTTAVINDIPDEPVELFFDSFEDGSLANWSQDSQNDWFNSTQRSRAGSRSAEIDGSASDATLTLTDPINLSGSSEANLTFSWFIESGLDSGEYLAIDLWNGTTWVEAARLRGNVDPENTWHDETINLSSYLISNFRLRFRGRISSSWEDANLDTVRIMG